jgi:hypothetical protein
MVSIQRVSPEFNTIADVSLVFIDEEQVPQLCAFKPPIVNKKKKVIKENPILFIIIFFDELSELKLTVQ